MLYGFENYLLKFVMFKIEIENACYHCATCYKNSADSQNVACHNSATCYTNLWKSKNVACYISATCYKNTRM